MTNTYHHEAVTEDILVALIEQEKAALNTQGLGVIEAQRAAANLAYAGVYTNDLAPSSGMSSVLINVVQPGTDTLTSHLGNIICSDDELVVFHPSSYQKHPIKFPDGQVIPVGSEKVSEQTTKLVNHVLFKMNDGHEVFMTAIKSALLNKNAVLKVTWCEEVDTMKQTIMDLSPSELQAFLAQLEQEGFECDVIEEEVVQNEESIDTPEMSAYATDYTGSRYVVQCTITRSKPRIECLPPEEFMINDEAICLDKNDELTRFVAHRKLMTIGDIEKMFPEFDTDRIGEAGPADDLEYDYEKLYRNSFDGTYDTVPNRYDTTGPNRLIEITESWIRADRDGDGYAEWVHSFSVGNSLIETEEWAGELPFASFTFWPVPHKFYGLGIYDKLQPYHRAKTGVVRQMLDHGTLANTPRYFGNPEYVNERDFQHIRPGLIKTRRGFSATDIVPVPVNSGSPHSIALLQFLDKEVLAQLGIDIVNGAISSEVEKSGNDEQKTSMVVDNASAKAQTYVRYISMALKDTMWQIYNLLLENADSDSVMELVETVTPGVPFLAAQTDMADYIRKDDLIAKVGLGHLTTQQKIRNLGVVQQTMAGLVQLGVPVPPAKHLFAAGELLKAAGFQNINDFLPNTKELQQAMQQSQQQQAPLMELQMRGATAEVMLKESDAQKKQSEVAENQMQTEVGYREQERKEFATQVDAEATYQQLEAQSQGKPVTQINTKIG